MTWIRGSQIVRLSVLLALLAGGADASKVICITPGGHLAVEDWAASCCLPERSGAGVSESGPCQGCADFAVITALDRRSAQPDGANAVADAPVEAAPLLSANPSPLHTTDLPEPAGFAPSLLSLRC